MELGAHVKQKTSYTDYPTRLLYLPRGIERLEKLGTRKILPKNYIIAEPGKFLDHCYIVRKGRVITYEFTPSGEERVYNFMEEGSLCLEANLLLNKPSPIYFKTAAPSELIYIGRETLMRAMAADPQITLDIIESISDKFFASMDQIRQSCCHNVSWKTCNLLLIFADRYGVPYDGKILIREKVSQQMLSNLLGINRITMVRALKELKELDLIEQINGYYCIRNMEKLKRHQELMDSLVAMR
jgi:CRP/FNR family transcriptional regulator